MLNINNEKSAAMFLDDDELVFEVLKYYRLAEHFNPGFKKSLMIGGSGYSFPKDYLKKFPLSELDVVEIDPKLTELAKEHFKLKQNQRLKIYHEDGRTFLNRTQNKYDVVYMDAYKSLITIPYQLTTKEAIQKIYNVLNNNGVVFANIISAIGGKNNLFLQAEYATYKSVFPQVYLFAVQDPYDTQNLQNIMLVGLKSEKIPIFESDNKELNKYLHHLLKEDIKTDLPVLTDEYAPVDYYTSKAL